MFMVFWCGDKPHCKKFEADQMSDALKYMEALREKQRNGEKVSFVTMCSENPNSVGKPGVAEVGPDYNWKKRRA